MLSFGSSSSLLLLCHSTFRSVRFAAAQHFDTLLLSVGCSFDPTSIVGRWLTLTLTLGLTVGTLSKHFHPSHDSRPSHDSARLARLIYVTHAWHAFVQVIEVVHPTRESIESRERAGEKPKLIVFMHGGAWGSGCTWSVCLSPCLSASFDLYLSISTSPSFFVFPVLTTLASHICAAVQKYSYIACICRGRGYTLNIVIVLYRGGVVVRCSSTRPAQFAALVCGSEAAVSKEGNCHFEIPKTSLESETRQGMAWCHSLRFRLLIAARSEMEWSGVE